MARTVHGKSSRSTGTEQPVFPRWHWRLLFGTSLAALLSIVAVTLSARYYLKNKERAKPPTEEVAQTNHPDTKPAGATSKQVTKRPDPTIDEKKPETKKVVTSPQPKPKSIETSEQPPKLAATATPEKININEVVLVEKAPEPLSLPVGTSFSILKREIIRQSLLLTAREQFGLRVRDGALAETTPNRLPAAQRLLITSVLTPGKLNFVQVEQGELGARKPVLKVELASTIDDIRGLVATVEQLSRKEIVELLKGGQTQFNESSLSY